MMNRILILLLIVVCLFTPSLLNAQDEDVREPIAVGILGDKTKLTETINRTSQLFLQEFAFSAVELTEPATSMISPGGRPFFAVFENVNGQDFDFLICLPLYTSSENFYKQFGKWGTFAKTDAGDLKFNFQGVETFVGAAGDYVLLVSNKDVLQLVPDENPLALVPAMLNQQNPLFQFAILPQRFSPAMRRTILANPNWPRALRVPGARFKFDDFEAIHVAFDLVEGQVKASVDLIGTESSMIAHAARSDQSLPVPSIARFANKRSAIKGWMQSRSVNAIVSLIDHVNGPKGRELFVDFFDHLRQNGVFGLAFNFRAQETPSYIVALQIADGKEFALKLPQQFFSPSKVPSSEWLAFQINILKELGVDSNLFVSNEEIALATEDSVIAYSQRLPKSAPGQIGEVTIRCEMLIDAISSMGHFETFPEFYHFSKRAFSNFPGRDKIRLNAYAHDRGYKFSVDIDQGATYALLDVPLSIGALEETTFETISSELDDTPVDDSDVE